MAANDETLDGGVEETKHDGEELLKKPRELLTLVVTAIGQRWSRKRYDDTQQLREAALSKGELKPLVSALEYVEGIEGATVDVAGLLEPNIRFMDSSRKLSSVHAVCALGDLDALKALKEKCGVDPREAKPDTHWKWSPLHEAAAGGHGEVVAYLVECGLDHCEKEAIDSMTPRGVASFEGHNSVAYMLEKMDRESFRRGPGKKTACADLRMGTVLKPRHEMKDDNDIEDARMIVGYIGSGSFGDVYKVINNRTGKDEAVKIVKQVVKTDELGTQQSQQRDAEFIRLLKSQLDEADTMFKIGPHRNIVSIRGIQLLRNVLDVDGTTLTDNLYVYMDYVSGGRTLRTCILSVTLTDDEVGGLLYDVAQGLRHVESKNLTHWDLKPDNVLVECKDVDGRLRPVKAMISDFGEGCTEMFASAETLAFFRAPHDDPTTRGELREKAKKTQHLWSWATTALDVLRVRFLLGNPWDDHRGVLAVFTGYCLPKSTPSGSPLATCFKLCGSCLDCDQACSVQHIVDALAESLKDDASKTESPSEWDAMEQWLMRCQVGTIYQQDLTQTKDDYKNAAAHFEAARNIAKERSGPDSELYAASLNFEGRLLSDQGKYDEAKYDEAQGLYERVIEIFEKALGRDHPNVATVRNNLAELLRAQVKYDEAKPLYERAIEIGEKTLGPDHPDLAVWLNNLAELLRAQGKYDKAKPLYERSLGIREKTLGEDHPAVATGLNNLAELLRVQGKYDEAKPRYDRAIKILEKSVGEVHPDYALVLSNLALLLSAQRKYDKAEPLTVRAIEIGEETLGPNHPDVAVWLNNLARLLQDQGKYDKAKPFYERAIEIGEKTVGPNHPAVATRLNGLARLLTAQGLRVDYDCAQGKYNEARLLHDRALKIREISLGKDHPDVAQSLNDLAALSNAQGEHSEATTYLQRVVVILEASIGEDHPNLATALNNLALLLWKMGRVREAVPHQERATDIIRQHRGEAKFLLTEYQGELDSLRAGRPYPYIT